MHAFTDVMPKHACVGVYSNDNTTAVLTRDDYLTFTLPEVFYDVIMPYVIHINDVILWVLKRPHW